MKKRITYSIGSNKSSLDVAGLVWTLNGTEFVASHERYYVLDGDQVHVPALRSDIAFVTDSTYDDDFLIAAHNHAIALPVTYKYQEIMLVNVLAQRLKFKHFMPVPTWRSDDGALTNAGTQFEWKTKSDNVVIKYSAGAMGLGQFKVAKKDFNEDLIYRDLSSLNDAEFTTKYQVTGGESHVKKLRQSSIITEEIPIVAEYRLMKSPKGNIYGYRRNVVERVTDFKQADGRSIKNDDILPLNKLITNEAISTEIAKLVNALLPNKHGSLDLVMTVIDPDGPITDETVKWAVFEWGYQFGCMMTGGGVWFRDFMRQCIYEYAELEGF